MIEEIEMLASLFVQLVSRDATAAALLLMLGDIHQVAQNNRLSLCVSDIARPLNTSDPKANFETL